MIRTIGLLAGCALVAMPAMADTVTISASVDHLRPVGSSGQILTLIVKESLHTGCPADAERRLSIVLPSVERQQGWLLAMRKARENNQKLELTVDPRCDAFGAAKVIQISGL